jgi:hypothetical protein
MTVLIVSICGLLIPAQSDSKTINIRGTTICRYKGDVELEKTAKCVIVAPKDKMELNVVTFKNGFFGIDLPYNDIINKPLTINLYDYQGFLKSKSKYIYDEKIIRMGDSLVFKFGEVKIDKNCELIEEEECIKANAYLTQLREKEISKKGPPSFIIPVMGGVMSALAFAVTAGGGGDVDANGPPPTIIEMLDIGSVSKKDNADGRIFALALDGVAGTPGFQFSPTRNISDAVFFNSSAITFSPYRQVNILSDFNEYSQVSSSFNLGDAYGIGIGALFLDREENRTALTESNESASSSFKSEEWGAFLSLSRKISNDVSIGLTAKYLSQSIETPDKIEKRTIDPGNGELNISYSLLKDKIEEEQYDFDISGTYKINNRFQFGLSVMNIAGAELLTNDDEYFRLRSVGLGMSYKNRRVHLGTDIIAYQEGETDFSVGINIVPFSNAEINFGYGSAFQTIVAGAKYRIPKFAGLYIAPTYKFLVNDEFEGAHFFGLSGNF